MRITVLGLNELEAPIAVRREIIATVQLETRFWFADPKPNGQFFGTIQARNLYCGKV